MRAVLYVALAFPLLLPLVPAAGEAHVVNIVSNSFIDSESEHTWTTIAAGTTVTWVWNSGVHSVTEGYVGNDGFDSGIQATPTGDAVQTFSVTFTEPGVHLYRCLQHTLMRGQIVVEP